MQQLHTTTQKNMLLWAISDSWVLTKRSTKHIVRNLDHLLAAILMPVVLLLLFRYILGGAIDLRSDVDYVNYLISGTLVQTLAIGASTTTYNLALDLHRGIIDRFRSLPMFTPSLLIGHVTADLVRNIFSSSVVLGVSFLVGFRPAATPIQWLGVLGLALLFTFAFSWISAILGLLVKNIEASQWVSFSVVMPLTLASSGFVPTSSMPPALKFFAENQPLTQVIETIRGWFLGTPVGDTVWLAIAWCLGIIAISVPIATWLFRGYKSH
jgi:ABC-2 type transport system permease protein